MGVPHDGPLHPAAHAHVPGATHTPWPPQPSMQIGVSHVAPDQPAAQPQTPGATHAPCAPHAQRGSLHM